MRSIIGLARLGPRRQVLLVEAALQLMMAGVLLAALPFRRIAKRFGRLNSPHDRPAEENGDIDPRQAAQARRIGWAIRVAARHVPFHAVCLHQAMAAQAMLRRRGIASMMYFGAARGTIRPIEAHAWLSAAGVRVTGYPVAPNIAILGCFV